MPDILLLEWKFEPADLFEEAMVARTGGYEFAIEWGFVQCRIPVDVESEDYWLRQRTEAHQQLDALFLAAQTLSSHQCKLLKPAVSRIRESGGTDLYAFPLTAAIRVVERRPDVILKGADGVVVTDTKRQRIDHRNKLALLAAAHITDPVANSILRSFSASVNDSANELVHLYEIREAVTEAFGSEQQAMNKLGITPLQRRRFRDLTNDEPLVQGRHRGRHPGTLRDATVEELEEARDIARQMIESYLHSL